MTDLNKKPLLIHPQQQKEYVISETLVQAIGEWSKGPHNIVKISELLRSRPYTAPALPNSQELLVPKGCESCDKHTVSGPEDSCPNEDYCGETGCELNRFLMNWVSIHGCLLHTKVLVCKGDSCIYKKFAKNMRNAEEHDAAVAEKAVNEALDKIIKDFGKDMCPYPPDEPCRGPTMGCDECFIDYFNSFRKPEGSEQP